MTLKLMLVLMFVGMTGVSPAMAGSLNDLQSAVDGYAASGKISDQDVRAMLSDLISKARLAPDATAETSLRSSIIDIVDSFEGASIAEDAAAGLRSLAQR